MYVSTVSLLRIRNNEIPTEGRVPTSNLSLFNSIIYTSVFTVVLFLRFFASNPPKFLNRVLNPVPLIEMLGPAGSSPSSLSSLSSDVEVEMPNTGIWPWGGNSGPMRSEMRLFCNSPNRPTSGEVKNTFLKKMFWLRFYVIIYPFTLVKFYESIVKLEEKKPSLISQRSLVKETGNKRPPRLSGGRRRIRVR